MRSFTTSLLHHRIRLLLYWITISLFSVSTIHLYPSKLQAMTTVKVTLQKAINQALVIVHGTIMKKESYREGTRIMSLFTIRTHEILKGHERFKRGVKHTVLVSQRGGELDGFTQHIAGSPVLTEGSEWVFFLTPARVDAIHSNPTVSQAIQNNSLYAVESHVYGSTPVRLNAQGVKVVLTQELKTKMTKPLQIFPTTHIAHIQLKKTLDQQAKVSMKVGETHQAIDPQHTRLRNHLSSEPSSAQLISVERYLEELKKAIDQSTAPSSPSH